MGRQAVEILLVEDNEDDIVMIREAFEEDGAVRILQVVRDGEAAMAYLRREGPYKEARQPGLVLLDIAMPKKDGFEVLKEIKADAGLKHLPVIMLTTSTREEDMVKAYSAGASSYIPKPVGFRRLQEVAGIFKRYWSVVSRIPSPGG